MDDQQADVAVAQDCPPVGVALTRHPLQTTAHRHVVSGRPREQVQTRIEETLLVGAGPGEVVGTVWSRVEGQRVGPELALLTPLGQQPSHPLQRRVGDHLPLPRSVRSDLHPTRPGRRHSERGRRQDQRAPPDRWRAGPEVHDAVRSGGWGRRRSCKQLAEIQRQDRPGHDGEEWNGPCVVGAEQEQQQPQQHSPPGQPPAGGERRQEGEQAQHDQNEVCQSRRSPGESAAEVVSLEGGHQQAGDQGILAQSRASSSTPSGNGRVKACTWCGLSRHAASPATRIKPNALTSPARTARPPPNTVAPSRSRPSV